MQQPDERARQLATEAIDQLDRIDTLAAYAGEDPRANKIWHIALTLRNYACERVEEAIAKERVFEDQEYNRRMFGGA